MKGKGIRREKDREKRREEKRGKKRGKHFENRMMT